MNIVSCNKCGSEVDTHLISCPRCGTPIGYKGGTHIPRRQATAEEEETSRRINRELALRVLEHESADALGEGHSVEEIRQRLVRSGLFDSSFDAEELLGKLVAQVALERPSRALQLFSPSVFATGIGITVFGIFIDFLCYVTIGYFLSLPTTLDTIVDWGEDLIWIAIWIGVGLYLIGYGGALVMQEVLVLTGLRKTRIKRLMRDIRSSKH
jgi:hypothetical protein